MKDKIMKALIFLRIVDDHDQLLSLTNVALIIALAKLCMATSTSMTDIGGLFTVLLAYTSKKYINSTNNSAQ